MLCLQHFLLSWLILNILMLVCCDHATSADYKITYIHTLIPGRWSCFAGTIPICIDSTPSHILLLFALAYLFSYRLSSVLILPHLRWTHKCEVSWQWFAMDILSSFHLLIMPRFSVVDSSLHFTLVFNVSDILINFSLINPVTEELLYTCTVWSEHKM